jgi:uncharacterized protein
VTDELRAAEPATTGERISAIDVLRGVAVLGILLINIEDFGLPHADKSAAGTEWVGAYFPAGLGARGITAWIVFRALFEGKMRAIFSMLFGAGAVLLTSRLERRGGGTGAADVYYRRTLWLLAFGLVHAYLLWEGDILYGYALGGLFLFPLRKLRPHALLVAGGVLLALSLPRAALMASHRQEIRALAARADSIQANTDSELSPEEEEAQAEWDDIRESYTPDAETLRRARADYLGGYARLFARRAPLVAISESSDFYGWAFFDGVGMMLIGMALLKLGVLTAERSGRFYAGLAAAGFGVGLPLGALASYELYAHRFDPVAVAWSTALYDPSRLAVALGHVAVVMMIVRSGRARGVTGSLAGVGRAALTCYLGTTLICTTLFNGYGLGLFGALGRTQLYLLVGAIWGAELVFARLWLARFRFGPFEWAWRSLTYWKRQPLRLAPGEAGARAAGQGM